MDIQESRVSVNLTLSRELYERASETAVSRHLSLERLLQSLVSQGLDERRARRERWEHLSEQYRARLAADGTLDQSSDEVLETLRRIREETANELYP